MGSFSIKPPSFSPEDKVSEIVIGLTYGFSGDEIADSL
jgi:hypothetical protein